MARTWLSGGAYKLTILPHGDRGEIEHKIRALNLGKLHIFDADGNPVE